MSNTKHALEIEGIIIIEDANICWWKSAIIHYNLSLNNEWKKISKKKNEKRRRKRKGKNKGKGDGMQTINMMSNKKIRLNVLLSDLQASLTSASFSEGNLPVTVTAGYMPRATG